MSNLKSQTSLDLNEVLTVHVHHIKFFFFVEMLFICENNQLYGKSSPRDQYRPAVLYCAHVT